MHLLPMVQGPQGLSTHTRRLRQPQLGSPGVLVYTLNHRWRASDLLEEPRVMCVALPSHHKGGL